MGLEESVSKAALRGVWLYMVLTIGIFVTVWWCFLLGAHSLPRSSLAFALCSASFGAGGVIGFMFTIFGDEQGPFGKIQEAMIALTSGLTGVGLAKAADFGAVIGRVHIFESDPERNASFSILLVIAYFLAGFFMMYFIRKLALNPALADARSEMDRTQISRDVSIIAGKIMERLPQSLLLGRDFIEEVDALDPAEESRLRQDLYAGDVNQFLAECQTDAQNGLPTQAQNIAMAARLHYYRVYFEKEGTSERNTQEKAAHDWILRALMRDPTNPDLQIKLADIFGIQGRYVEAVSIIEKLVHDESSPQYTEQWLGYYLLFIEGREEEAIAHSMDFHKRFPDESSGLFNASCGYAQLYSIELEQTDTAELPESKNRHSSLAILQQAIRADADLKALAVKHTDEGDSFESLKSDPDFIRLTAPADKRPLTVA